MEISVIMQIIRGVIVCFIFWKRMNCWSVNRQSANCWSWSENRRYSCFQNEMKRNPSRKNCYGLSYWKSWRVCYSWMSCVKKNCCCWTVCCNSMNC